MALWDNIQGKWKLASTTWTDTSGNGNTLTASASSPTAAIGHGGGTNLATAFASASSQDLKITDAAQTGLDITGNLTIAAWVYKSATGTVQIIAGKDTSDPNRGYILFAHSNNSFYFRVSPNGSAPLTQVASTTTLSANTWYHIVGVYNGTDLRIYVNGSLDCTPVSYSGGIYNNTTNFIIGSAAGGNYWNGRIDDVAVWSRALSADEVLALYNSIDDFIFITFPIPKATFNFTGKIPVASINYRLGIPKANFNFTGKVLSVMTSAPTNISIPVATFNFTRFAPIIRTQDRGVQIPKATFNFTGKVPTISLSANLRISIPKANFNFTGKAPSVLLTNTEEEISWGLFDTNGSPITGATPTIRIRNRISGYILDWSDNTFKLGGGSSPSSNMTEMDASGFPGYYKSVISIGGWSDGWYIAATTYSGSPSQNGSIEFLIKDGLMVDSYNSSNLDMAVSTVNTNVSSRLAASAYTAPDNPTLAAIKAKTDTINWGDVTDLHNEALGKWIIDPVARTLTLYKIDGVNVLKTFTLGETSSSVPVFISRTPQ